MAPASPWKSTAAFLNRFRALYTKQQDVHYPPIDQSTATLLTILFTVLYVAPFYISPALRSTSQFPRNSPVSIKARCRSVVLTCLICTVITVYILAIPGLATPLEVLSVLGLFPVDPLDTAKCLLLVSILFIGPLFENGIVEGDWRYWFRPISIKAAIFDDWIGWRNLVVGPVSEELIFRSFAIAIFLLAQANPTHIVFGTPLIFGLAHVHHFNENILANQTPTRGYLATLLTPSVLLQGLLRAIFQLTYTSLFGFFVAFVYLRTGNVYSCILAHTFCNWQGLPRFWGRVGQVAGDEAAQVVGSKRDDDNANSGKAESRVASDDSERTMVPESLIPGKNAQAWGIQWSVAYYSLLVLGSVGFYMLLWPLTESKRALARF